MDNDCDFTTLWVIAIMLLMIHVYTSLRPELKDAQRRIAVLEQQCSK